MNFEPRPKNDFARFIRTYYDRCRAVCPKIRAIAGKWTFEDLIPGLSDFDTRFIVSDDVTVEEWSAMSIAVGRVHCELARKEPNWARVLEHLPGLNLTFSEMTDPIGYYPEFHHWTFHHREDDAIVDRVTKYLADRPWDARDEAYHLKKFVTYFGPYQRGIDPPVNLGAWESKYPLHSRYMHYFAPAVQAAVSIVRRGAVQGKLEALHAARETFANPQVIDQILATLERHYEIPADYIEPQLTKIERSLEKYLDDAYREIAQHVSVVQLDASDTSPKSLRNAVAQIPVHPAQQFFDGVRFCRFMKGRLLFYSEPIAWFDTDFLIRNELGRIVKNFCETPLHIYGQVRFGESLSADSVLDRLRGDLLSDADCDAMRAFAKEGSVPLEPAREKARARRIADFMDAVLRVTECLGQDLRQRLNEPVS